MTINEKDAELLIALNFAISAFEAIALVFPLITFVH